MVEASPASGDQDGSSDDPPIRRLGGLEAEEPPKKSECQELTELIASSITNSLLSVMMRTVDVIFLGHLGVNQLASGSLGSALFNSVWVFIYGSTSALVTLVSPAFGAGNREAVGFWTRVSLTLSLLACLPASIILMFSYYIFLHLFQQSEEVSEQAALFCKYSIPGLFGYIIFTIYQRRQFCEHNVMPSVVVSAISNVVNVAANYYFIWGLGLGFVGSPIATSLSRLFMMVCILLYEWLWDDPKARYKAMKLKSGQNPVRERNTSWGPVTSLINDDEDGRGGWIRTLPPSSPTFHHLHLHHHHHRHKHHHKYHHRYHRHCIHCRRQRRHHRHYRKDRMFTHLFENFDLQEGDEDDERFSDGEYGGEYRGCHGGTVRHGDDEEDEEDEEEDRSFSDPPPDRKAWIRQRRFTQHVEEEEEEGGRREQRTSSLTTELNENASLLQSLKSPVLYGEGSLEPPVELDIEMDLHLQPQHTAWIEQREELGLYDTLPTSASSVNAFLEAGRMDGSSSEEEGEEEKQEANGTRLLVGRDRPYTSLVKPAAAKSRRSPPFLDWLFRGLVDGFSFLPSDEEDDDDDESSSDEEEGVTGESTEIDSDAETEKRVDLSPPSPLSTELSTEPGDESSSDDEDDEGFVHNHIALFLQGCNEYLSYGLPGAVNVSAEEWSLEVSKVIAAQFGIYMLAAHSILLSIWDLFFTALSWPLSRVASTHIGMFIGMGSKEGAKSTAFRLLLVTWVGEVVLILVTLRFSKELASVFTISEDITQVVVLLIPYLALHQFADGTQVVCSGIFWALGRQQDLAVYNLTAYWACSLPLGCLLAFVFDMELKGLWIAFIVAISLESIFLLVKVLAVDWDEEILKAKENALVLEDQFGD